MSVRNVSFSTWKMALPLEKQMLSDEVLQELFKYEKQEKMTGTEVEHVTLNGDEENSQARKAANEDAVDEMSETKKKAQEKQAAQEARSAEKKAGDYAPTEMYEEERYITEKSLEEANKDKAFYKSNKAQRKAKKMVEEAIKESFDAEGIKYKNRDVRKWAKGYTEALASKDKVEHTRVFATGAEKRAFRRENEEEDLRLRKHNKKYIGQQNVHLHKGETVEGGASLHQGAYEQISNTIGADLEANPNEIKHMMDEASIKRRKGAVEKEVKKLGYDVQNDAWKTAIKALVPAAGAGLSAAAFKTNVTAIATAIATVTDSAGNVLAEDKDVAIARKTVNNYPGAAVAAATAGILSAAMFGGSEDEHVLHGTQIEKVFQPSVAGKKYYQTATFGTYTNSTRTILEAIDSIEGLDDAQKTNILKIAAGEDSMGFLSAKELIGAYMMASNALDNPDLLEEITPEDPCPPCDCEETDIDIDTDTDTDTDGVNKPEYKPEITKNEIGEEQPIETVLPHISNKLYGWNIAQEGYYLDSGKPLTNDQIREIIDDIYTNNNVRQKQQDSTTKYVIPKFWILRNEITLKDGTVVKLKEYEELSKIKGEKSDASDKVGFDKDRNPKPKTKYRVVRTDYGFVIQKKEPGADDWTTFYTKEPTSEYTSEEEALDAAYKEIEKLKAQDEAQE